MLIFLFVSTHPIRPHDFWWHLRAGQEIAATGGIPTADEFSFTMAGTPYDNYASFWLMELTSYQLYELGGPALVIFIHALVIAAAWAVLLTVCWQVSVSWRIAAAATLGAAVLGFNDWNVRPQGIAFLLGAIYLWAIYAYRRRPRRWLLVIFPITMLAWANSHGSFVMGLLLLGIWLADSLWHVLWKRRTAGHWMDLVELAAPAVALTTTLLASLVNPRGLGLWTYVGSLATDPAVQALVPEWAPSSFGTPRGAIFIVALLLSAALMALSPRRPSAFELLTFLVSGVLALRSTRGVSWFGMVMAPILAAHLAALAAQVRSVVAERDGKAREVKQPSTKATGTQGSIRGSGTVAMSYLVVGMLALVAVLAVPWLKHLLPLPVERQGLISTETPVGATDYLLRQRPLGQLFHEMGFGSYLIWAAYPDYQVFVDPRIELYPLELWQEYLMISAAQPDWEQRLAERDVNTLLLSPKQQPDLVEAARLSPSWRQVYEDQAAVILVRN